MNNILQSASKLVLLAVSLAVIAGLFTGKISGQQFMNVVMIVFTYYFTRRANKKGDENI